MLEEKKVTGSLFNAATPRPSFHATMASVPRQKAKHPKYWRKSYCPPLPGGTLPFSSAEREREREGGIVDGHERRARNISKFNLSPFL